MTITYRETKGSPLTWEELDTNFVDLNYRTKEGWNDIVSPVIVLGANQPSLATWADGFPAYEFSATTMNECFVNFHLIHDYNADGGDVGYEGMVYPHTHWSVNTSSTGTVRWGVEYRMARRADAAGAAAFTTPATIYFEQTIGAGGLNEWHIVTEAATGNGIPNAGVLQVDSLIMCRYFRDAAHVNDTFPDPVYLLTVDIHYPCLQQQTPSRFPPFIV